MLLGGSTTAVVAIAFPTIVGAAAASAARTAARVVSLAGGLLELDHSGGADFNGVAEHLDLPLHRGDGRVAGPQGFLGGSILSAKIIDGIS